MKILRMVMVAVALLLAPAYAFSAELGWMHISLIEGNVQIQTPDAGDWGAAAINGPLREGDQIWSPQGGRIELQLNSGSYIRLAGNSALQILSLDSDSSQFYLSQGQVYVYYDAPEGSVLQVDTPDASTRAFVSSVFRIDISDQYTDVAVYKGYVETENQMGQTRINAGQMVSLAQNTEGEVGPMGPPDDWERWNKERDERIFARSDTSSRYLPPELKPYSYDLDTGGRWINVPDYGYCWTPTVGIGWAPYRLGRWAWIGGDYVWISRDPWGWAPYHYGRWAFAAGIGWCWVPPLAGEVYWGPGFVGWVRTGNYVAWVPLAPGEIYYGRGYYGRHSVNIAHINIKQVNITHIYKNVSVSNGVVIVDRKTFAAGSHKFVHLDRNDIEHRLFAGKNISVGAPAIKPSKASYFMSARRIPPAKLPPLHVRNLQVKQVKQSRPLVRDPGKSVLNPGAGPRQLPLNTVTLPRAPGRDRPTIRPIQPLEQRGPGGPEGPPPRGERPQVKPQERSPVAPESPAPRREIPQVAPREQKPVAPGGLPPRGERPQIKPQERSPVAPESPAPRREMPQLAPPEQRSVAPGGPPPRGESPQVRPQERSPVAPEDTPPKGKREDGTPGYGPQKDEKRTMEKPERR